MFGSRSRQAAEKNAFLLERAFMIQASFMKPMLGGYAKESTLQDVERNSYLAGYINGKLDSFSAYYYHQLKFPIEQINEVRAKVLNEIYEDDIKSLMRLFAAIKSHEAKNSDEFKEGRAKGIRIVSYLVGVHDPSTDPDFSEAIKVSQTQQSTMESLGFDSSIYDDPDIIAHMDAVMGLEMLWWFIPKRSINK